MSHMCFLLTAKRKKTNQKHYKPEKYTYQELQHTFESAAQLTSQFSPMEYFVPRNVQTQTKLS